jgi:hypothetical protein
MASETIRYGASGTTQQRSTHQPRPQVRQLCCELCYSGIALRQHSFTIRLPTTTSIARHCQLTGSTRCGIDAYSMHQPCCELSYSGITLRYHTLTVSLPTTVPHTHDC